MRYENLKDVPVPLQRYRGIPLQLEQINEIATRAQEMEGPFPKTVTLAQAEVMANYDLVDGQYVKKGE